MKQNKLHLVNLSALSALITLFWVGAPAKAQSAPAQNNPSTMPAPNDSGSMPAPYNPSGTPAPTTNGTTSTQTNPTATRPKDNDPTRPELARFDEFLNSHPEVAEQLRKDPSLANNPEFLKSHPALQTYLQQNPAIRTQLKSDPSAFMRDADRMDRRDDARGRDFTANREQMARFNEFLDSHREIAEQVRKNPSLVNNQAFVENHPALITYLQEHPEVRQDLRDNPNAFMRQDENFDRRQDAQGRDNDTRRQEEARFNQFLDNHREIAEQVRKNPALVNDSDFDKNHPVLQAYLQDHPAIRDEARDNPYAFRAEEGQFDRNENGADRDMMGRDRVASFHEFLGNHSDIAQQLSHNPALAQDKDYQQNHPDFRDYLRDHPDVNQELMNNPQNFIHSAQQPSFTNSPTGQPGATKTPADPKAFH